MNGHVLKTYCPRDHHMGYEYNNDKYINRLHGSRFRHVRIEACLYLMQRTNTNQNVQNLILGMQVCKIVNKPATSVPFALPLTRLMLFS